MYDFDSIKRGMASATIRGLALSAALAAAAPAAGQLFDARRTLRGAGDGPLSVSIGDLDGDGVPDLAVANRFSDDVSVLLGAGDGTFAADGAPDLAALRRGGLRPRAAFGAGDSRPCRSATSTATAPRTSPSPTTFSGDVSVLLGAGDGTFAAEQRFAAGDFPTSVSIGDLDGDGAPDLAVAEQWSPAATSRCCWAHGRRDLRRRAALRRGGLPVLRVDRGPRRRRRGGPRRRQQTSDDVSVLLGAGDGTFAGEPEQRFAAGSDDVGAGQSVSIGDLDGDGAPDLAVANAGTDESRGPLIGDLDGDDAVANDGAARCCGRRDLRRRAALRRGGRAGVRVDRGPRRRRRPGPRRRQRDSDDVSATTSSVLLGDRATGPSPPSSALAAGDFPFEKRGTRPLRPCRSGTSTATARPDLAVANAAGTER